MHLVQAHKSPELTLESMFSAKYLWLLRWALHFAQNDRAVAEDLVQETFVRILLTWDKLVDLDDIEPLLYTQLRYVYLTERRRNRSHAFQGLSTVDLDTLAISLRTSMAIDQIEVQNELRKILAFLLWRKRSARFASIFLLRFFHGFFPEEIAGICIIKRHGVDFGLRHARAELKTYLSNAESQVKVLGRGPAPEYKPLNMAIPAHEFSSELRASIFSSPREVCPSSKELERHYCSLDPRPLENELIAHIVSCEPCLDKVSRLCGVPPSSARSMEDSLERASRAKQPGKTGSSEKEILARIFAQGKDRVREIFEHNPSGLAIALNGEIVAVRDVSSPRAVLKVETRSIEKLDIIEVFSEQGQLMLALPLLRRPPQSQPELRHEVALSSGRSLTLVVSFTADGVLVEATYLDPHFIASAATADSFSYIIPEQSGMEDGGLHHGGLHRGPAEASLLHRKPSRWRRLFEKLHLRLPGTGSIVAITAGGLLAVSLLTWMMVTRQQEKVGVHDLLHNAMRAESEIHLAHGSGAIHQRIQIHTNTRIMQRDLYRDIQGRRHPKAHPMDNDERLLKTKLVEAKLDWDDPLSAASFQSWHDALIHEHDRVDKTGANLLTLTTTATDGIVLRESLTVRLDDFHPVARTLLFRDQQSVEISELSYDIVPWGRESEGWFEPESNSSSPMGLRSSSTPHFVMPPRVSESQIDLAELNALLRLQELHADTERLQVTRVADGIEVKGIVESESRKHEIVDQLRMISRVTPNILSYHDLDTMPQATPEVTGVKAVSVTSGESPLDNYCELRQILRDNCRRLSYTLLNSSAILVRESKRLTDLLQQYPSSRPLTPTARVLLADLLRLHAEHLTAALQDQEQAFDVFGMDTMPHSATTAASSVPLNEAAQHNLMLLKELVYASDEHSRPASLITQELAASVEEARTALSRIPAHSADHAATSSSSIPTPHQD